MKDPIEQQNANDIDAAKMADEYFDKKNVKETSHAYLSKEAAKQFAADFAQFYHKQEMRKHIDYVNEICERIVYRMQQEFPEKHDMVKQAIEDHFEQLEKRLFSDLTKTEEG